MMMMMMMNSPKWKISPAKIGDSLPPSPLRSMPWYLTYLVDVVTWYGVVERTVEIIQQFDDLYRSTFRRQHCEPDDIREVERRARIHLRSNTASSFEFIRHITRTRRVTNDSAYIDRGQRCWVVIGWCIMIHEWARSLVLSIESWLYIGGSQT